MTGFIRDSDTSTLIKYNSRPFFSYRMKDIRNAGLGNRCEVLQLYFKATSKSTSIRLQNTIKAELEKTGVTKTGVKLWFNCQEELLRDHFKKGELKKEI